MEANKEILIPNLEKFIPASNPTSNFSKEQAEEMAKLLLSEIKNVTDYNEFSENSEVEWALGPIIFGLANKMFDSQEIKDFIEIIEKWLIMCSPGDDNESKNRYLETGIVCLYFINQNYKGYLNSCIKILYEVFSNTQPFEIVTRVWKTAGMFSSIVLDSNDSETESDASYEEMKSDFKEIIITSAPKFIIDEGDLKLFQKLNERALTDIKLSNAWHILFRQVLYFVFKGNDLKKVQSASMILKCMLKSDKLKGSNIFKCQEEVLFAIKESATKDFFVRKWPLNNVLSVFGKILLVNNPTPETVSILMDIIAGGVFQGNEWNSVLFAAILRNLENQNIEVKLHQIGCLNEVMCNNFSFFMKLKEDIIKAATKLDSNYIEGSKQQPLIYTFFRSITAIADWENPGIFSHTEEVSESISLIKDALSNVIWNKIHKFNYYHQLLVAINTFNATDYIRTLNAFIQNDYEKSIDTLLFITASLPKYYPTFFDKLTDISFLILAEIEHAKRDQTHLVPLLHLLYEVSQNSSLFDKNKELRVAVNTFSIWIKKTSHDSDIIEYANMLLFSVSAQKMKMSAKRAEEMEKAHKGHIGHFLLYNNLITVMTDESLTSTVIIRSNSGIISYRLTYVEDCQENECNSSLISKESLDALINTTVFTPFKNNEDRTNTKEDAAVLVRLGIVTADNQNNLTVVEDSEEIAKLFDGYNQSSFCSTDVALFRVTSKSKDLFDVKTSMKSSSKFERFLGDISTETFKQSVEGVESNIPLPIGENGSFKYSFVTPALFANESDNEESESVKKVFEHCKNCGVAIIFNESSPSLLLNNKANNKVVIEVKEVNEGLYSVKALKMDAKLPKESVLMTPLQMRFFIDTVVCATAERGVFCTESKRITKQTTNIVHQKSPIKELLNYILDTKKSVKC